MEWIGCPTLFATHFHELTELQHRIGVKNLHVQAKTEEETGELLLSFKVRLKIAVRSHTGVESSGV